MKTVKISKPPAIVLGLTPNGLSVVRNLGRHGVTVFGFESNRYTPARYSRYCRGVITGNFREDEQELFNALVSFREKLKQRPVIFPTADSYVLFLSKNRKRLRPHFRFALPSKEVIEAIVDKRKLHRYAEQCNIHFPQTFAPANVEELKSLQDKISYPAALKPAVSHLWQKKYYHKKLTVVYSFAELLFKFKKLSSEKFSVILQEIIPGRDDAIYSCYAYLNKDSRPLAVFTRKKLRQNPIHFGIACCAQSIKEPKIEKLALRLLNNMKYHGVAGVEFKKDYRDGEFKLIEINARTLLNGELAIRCGVELPYIAYQDLIGEPTLASKGFKEGVKLVAFERDLESYFAYRRVGEINLWSWLRSLKGKNVHPYFSWKDPLPFLITLPGFFKRVISYPFRSIKRRNIRIERHIKKLWRPAKVIIASILFYTGIVTLLIRLKGSKGKKVIILVYHQIEEKDSSRFINKAIFRKQIKFLKRCFKIITLKDALLVLKNNLPGRYAAITFDDGYRNTYTCAYPILQRLGVAATVFLIADSIETNSAPWTEALTQLIQDTDTRHFSLAINDSLFKYTLTASKKQRLKVAKELKYHLKKVKEEDKNAILKRLFAELKNGKTLKKYPAMLSWDEIRKMSNNGISFGSHTCTHPILTKISLSKAKKEISASKKIIEKRLKKPVELFCYPNGEKHDFSDSIKQVLRDEGFSCACTSIDGINNKNTDVFELKRVYTSEQVIPLFALRIARLVK